ncbi:MAG TPA: hypothetical protein VEU96_19800 [Bryobacteraceae bacterium]|nr:hypothetical protein [Bryobacteraceae bacterium]
MKLASAETPYLSVVATARNDDHGGNLLHRMQIFVDAWINQSKRHNLSSELIIVEWNPPRDRKPLAEALRWPADTGPCQVRIIEVPPELHARYHHAAALPLYQMLAKNVGIRRARGQFIVATNIDIIFSDELVCYLASGRLEKGRMYRIDRTDVMSDVPENGTLDDQLAYCRTHLIRVCAREGTYKLMADGLRKSEPADIVLPESGIHCGDGFCPVERYSPDPPFRWIGEEAELVCHFPAGGGLLEFEVEPGPGVGLDDTPMALEVLDWSGSVAATWSFSGRTVMCLLVPSPSDDGHHVFRLRVLGGGLPVVEDPRILNLRIFRCDWVALRSDTLAPPMATVRPMLMRLLNGWRKSHGLFSLLNRGRDLCRRAVRLLQARGPDIVEAGLEYHFGHGWYQLEPDGSNRFRWASENAELVIRSTGLSQTITLLVEPGPGMGSCPFGLEIRQAGGRVLTRATIHGLTEVEVPIPAPKGTVVALVLTPESPGHPAGEDPRILNFRVFAIGSGLADTEPPPLPPTWAALTPTSRPPAVNWAAALEKWRPQIAEMGKQEFIHMNACGDFTLMAREHWFDLRGYAEFDLFSMHLDSFLCWAAHFSGAREEILREPMRIYHVEHGVGSGWTPEGESHLYERIARKGIQSISHEELVEWIAQMRQMNTPVIFNSEDWGLATERLQEIVPAPDGMAASEVTL